MHVAVRLVAALLVCAPFMDAAADDGEAPFRCGVAKIDITPDTPVRLSGYGNRAQPYEGVDERLFARAVALQSGEGPPMVLVSVDTIGFPGVLTTEIHKAVEELHGLPRANLAVTFTHSHTAPHIGRGLSNLFSTPLSDDERSATEAYTDLVRDRVIEAVNGALESLEPARLHYAEGAAHFAVNRRVLQDGVWTGFGINAQGPVDHSLPVLKVTGANDELVAVLFNYACHCTTFGGDYNRVNGDWAGYAASYIEEAHEGAVALSTIGCGADANPERDSARALQIAQAQGREISDEVARLLSGEMTEITEPVRATYGFAGLPIDRPSVDELRGRLNDNSPQVRRHAEHMLEVHERMGRLPETYPMPIQVWRFADQFAMVFLGGEVCVDYAFRIKEELGGDDADAEALPVWVTAYANDVFGYVAPERMRSEGGYEVDFSMIYYLQPGRWSSGTEDVILRRVHELYDDQIPQGPLSLEDSLEQFTLPDGLAIGVVAAEPLIADPVNFAVGPDGRLWVVEMGDYPRGDPAHESNSWDRRPAPAGRIRVLTDVDGDGRYDEGVTFVDDLNYPTGVFPWRDGALITCAPDILFARDTDGDGAADEREVLYTGFVESNPQHRINGFCYGLDGWLYLGSGASSGDITCVRTGEVVNVSGRDSRIRPDDGLLQAESGETQFGRCRDDWGNWFGNSNSHPLFQFVISDRYLGRNPYVPSPHPRVFLTDPPTAPPVYPTSRTVDRFNDLFAEDRFTSACSPTIFRDATLGPDVQGAAFVCEPVHNLVSRLMLSGDGNVMQARRHPDEAASEFLGSRDNWFRPTRLATGPDGTLWVADMYRMVIEHPEWIPEAWQERLNLYAGNDRGRIYRVYRSDEAESGSRPLAIPDLTQLPDMDLVLQLRSSNGWRRDTAELLLVQRESITPNAESALRRLLREPDAPARLHALCVLDQRGLLTSGELELLLKDEHAGVVRQAVTISEQWLDEPPILSAVCALSGHGDPRVRLQAALSLGESESETAAEALAQLAIDPNGDSWQRAAVLSSARSQGESILAAVLRDSTSAEDRTQLVSQLIATTLGDEPASGAARVLAAILPHEDTEIEDWRLTALGAVLDALQRDRIDLARLEESSPALQDAFSDADVLFEQARVVARDADLPPARRAAASRVLARRPARMEADRAVLLAWLSPQEPPELQSAAVAALVRSGADQTASQLLSAWPAAAPALRSEILQALLTRESWTRSLLAALRNNDLSPADLDATTRNRLLEHPSEELRAVAASMIGAAGSADRQAVVDSHQSVLELESDPDRGAVVFQQRCATCHRHGDVGRDVGARLSALQNKTSEFLLTAILDPNRATEAKYTAYSVLMTDGRVLSGMIVEETATSLTLAKPDGNRDVLLRIDIEELSGTGKSFMPEGLERDLTPQQLADVIAFVQSIQQPENGGD